MEKVYLFHREKRIKTLGPGDRYVIWVQGCTHNCKGCIAPESHSLNSGGYWIKINDLLEEIKNIKGLRGVTISGGEPFLQAAALEKFCMEVRKLKLDVICFSGFRYEELKNGKVPFGRNLLNYIDILVDGKYIEELNTESYLRGSDNQRIIHLKNTYKKYENQMNALKNRNVEFKLVDNKTIFIAGIPPKKMEEDWDNIRKKLYKK